MEHLRKPSGFSSYRVGEWEVRPNACRIVRDGHEVRLTPKSMNVLDYLAARPGQAITYEELLLAFWRGATSSVNAVHKSVTELRRALGNGGGQPDYIETIPRRGYRLLASVAMRQEPVEIVGARPRTVAVLRFRNASNESNDRADERDRRDDYLAEAISVALLDCLSEAPELTVADRERSFSYVVGKDTVQSIGSALDVDYLLEGTVSGTGDRLRVTTALHRASDGELVYTHDDEAPIADIPQIQDKVIASVLMALAIHLDEQRVNHMREWGTRNVEAYLAVLEAGSLYRRLDQRSMQFAATRARAAICLDPGFIEAHVLLALVLQTLSDITHDPAARQPMREEVARIREAVTKLDDQAPALVSIRRLELKMTTRAWQQVEEAARAVILREGELQRTGVALVEYAELLKSGRLFRESARYLDLYEQFEKENPWVYMTRSTLTGLTVSPRRTIPMQRNILARFQNDVAALTTLISHLALIGAYDEAETYLVRLEEFDLSTFWSYAAWLQVGALRGDWRAGSAELHAVLDNPRANRFTRGIVHFILGDVAAGVDVWRDELYDTAGRGAPALLYAVYTEKYFPAAVVADPRYQDFLDEAGIGRQWTAYLRERVAELAPITGIEPGDSAPQRVWPR